MQMKRYLARITLSMVLIPLTILTVFRTKKSIVSKTTSPDLSSNQIGETTLRFPNRKTNTHESSFRGSRVVFLKTHITCGITFPIAVFDLETDYCEGAVNTFDFVVKKLYDSRA
jgi:hypothetical protein